MELTPVESSNLAAIGYDAGSLTLRVQFKNGGVYDYQGVSDHLFANLNAASSKGGFLAASIKPNYKAVKVEAAEKVKAVAEKIQVPSIGRIVHYVLPSGPHKGDHRPAIIVQVWGNPDATPESLVQLQVFLDGSNDTGNWFAGNANPCHWATSVKHDPSGTEFGTFHFPEYVPAVEATS